MSGKKASHGHGKRAGRGGQAAFRRRADEKRSSSANSVMMKVPEDLPAAFLERMRRDLASAGETVELTSREQLTAYEAFLASYDHAAVHALMPNTQRGASGSMLPFDFTDERILWNKDAVCYAETAENRPGKHVLHEAGAYYIQEASAMLPVRMLLDEAAQMRRTDDAGLRAADKNVCTDGKQPSDERVNGSLQSPSPEFFSNLRVLDLCAAPGGKSVQLAMAMQGRGLLVCNEIHPARAATLSRNLERMGVRNALVVNTSPDQLAACLPECFDLILTDAPCSGEGMFRKNPEAIREWSEENVEMCAERQREILDAAYTMLRPGGVMVYSTCTFAPAEDEEQAEAFVQCHPDLRVVSEAKLLPDRVYAEKGLPALSGVTGHFEGHYAACFRRDGSEVPGECNLPAPMPPAAFERPDPSLMRRIQDWIQAILVDPSSIGYAPERLILFGDHLYLLPKHVPALPQIRILRPGLELAEISRTREGVELIPAHALSHALRPCECVCTVDLSDAEAAAYLNGQVLPVSVLVRGGDGETNGAEAPSLSDEVANRKGAGVPTPYVLVCSCGFSLGWARISGRQLKNLYPKGLRVSTIS